MARETNQGTTLPEGEDFDTTSQKGWDFFTKFLLANVVVATAVLLLIGLLTVWS